MATLGQAYVQIVPSAEGISGSINNVLSGPADTAGKTAGKKFGAGFGTKVKAGLTTAGLGLAAFTAASGAAIAKGITDVAKYGDHVDKMSQKIGFSSDGFQKWDYVLQRAGSSIDSMGPAIKKLSSAAVQNSEAFQQLGISQEEVANMSQEELFGRTIEALSGMEEGAERTALASKLLGKGATELAPLLNEGTDAIKEQMQMAEDYGMVLSEESVKASADFVDAQTTLSNSFNGLKNRMSAEFLPAVTNVTNGLAKMFKGDYSGGLNDIKNGISDFVKSVGAKVPDMISAGGKMIVGFIQGVAKKLPELAQGAADMIRAFAERAGDDDSKGEMIAKAGELIGSLAGAMLESAKILLPAVIEAAIAFFKNTDWIGLGKTLVTNLWNGLKAMFPKVVAFVGSVVKSIAQKLGFTGLASKVRQVFNNVKSALTEPIDKAKELVDSAIEKIKGLFPISLGNIFSGIKLPHFRISGGQIPWGIGGAGTPPSVDVDWFAKGGIMTKPVLFGGGEAGKEAILPLDRNTEWMDKLADRIGGGTNVYVTVNGAESPEMWADRFAREFKLQARTI